jgi:xanthine dehydrogenase accessory factor
VDTLTPPPAPARLFTENVIPQLLAWTAAGVPSALVTLVGIDGSSPRRLGSQMAVNIHGDHLGYISSGCAEAAIVATAVETIQARCTRTIRYGAGSPYIDVVLPCGSGIDIHFDATVERATLTHVAAEIAARRTVCLPIPTGLSPDPFIRTYDPVPRIIVAGRSINVDFVARFAHDLEWDIVTASPEPSTLARLAPIGRTHHLTAPADFDATLIDAHTAVVLMFHDHDWEPAILAKCAGSSAFYVGALGSRRTHAQRRELLALQGCAAGFIDAIHCPVGMNIGAKNPAEIALAVVAEILATAPKTTM